MNQRPTHVPANPPAPRDLLDDYLVVVQAQQRTIDHAVTRIDCSRAGAE